MRRSIKRMVFVRAMAVLPCLLVLAGCRGGVSPLLRDKPHLSPDVHLLDLTVHSKLLGRDMPLRVIVPASHPASDVPVIYFLHGAGTDYRDWSNNSGVSQLAADGAVLVFPDAPDSYYIDELRKSHNADERYLTLEVPTTVHAAIPYAATERAHTAVVGISRGGYGAALWALKHPEFFGFAGELSGALHVNEDTWYSGSPLKSWGLRRVFGPPGSPTRLHNDVFALAAQLPVERAPYFYLACGTGDSLLATSQRFDRLLTRRGMAHETHFGRGEHNWGFWGSQIYPLEQSLRAHGVLPAPSQPAGAAR